MPRFKHNAPRLAGLCIVFVAVILMAGCRSDWSDIFGFDGDNRSNNNDDTTAPIDETDVAGLDVVVSVNGFDDTADMLRTDINAQSARTVAYDFQARIDSDTATSGSNTTTIDTGTTGTGTTSPGIGSSGNGTPGSGGDNGTPGIGEGTNGTGDTTGTTGSGTGSMTTDSGTDTTDTGGTLRSARVIAFDVPSRLTPIIQADPRAGLDLPTKVLIYEDNEGGVGVAYNDPNYLRARYNVSTADGSLAAMGNNLQTLAQDAAGGNGVSRRGTVSAIGRGQGIVATPSDSNFDTTLDRLLDAIDGRSDLTLANQIDHRALAQSAGGNLDPNTLLIVRDDDNETPLVATARTVAIDLPQKILVTRTAGGQVVVYTNDADYIARRHGITGRDDQIDAMADEIADVVAAATGTSGGTP